jgi:hypothetical protein
MEKPKKSSCGCFPMICKKSSKPPNQSNEFHQRLRSTILSNSISPKNCEENILNSSLVSVNPASSHLLISPGILSPTVKTVASTNITEETPTNLMNTLRNRVLVKLNERLDKIETAQKTFKDFQEQGRKEIDFKEKLRQEKLLGKCRLVVRKNPENDSKPSNHKQEAIPDQPKSKNRIIDQDIDQDHLKEKEISITDFCFQSKLKEEDTKNLTNPKKSFKANVKIKNISNEVSFPANFPLSKTKSPSNLSKILDFTPNKKINIKSPSNEKSKEIPLKLRKPISFNTLKSKKRLFLVKNDEEQKEEDLKAEEIYDKDRPSVIQSRASSVADTVIINSVDSSQFSNLFCRDHEISDSEIILEDKSKAFSYFFGQEDELKVKSIPFGLALSKCLANQKKINKKGVKSKKNPVIVKGNSKSLPYLVATSPKQLGNKKKVIFKFK